jgi:hypothetical protein
MKKINPQQAGKHDHLAATASTVPGNATAKPDPCNPYDLGLGPVIPGQTFPSLRWFDALGKLPAASRSLSRAAGAVSLIAVAVLAGCSTPGSSASPQGASVSGQSAPSSISGSMDDWLAAVCLQGTFSNGKKGFPNAAAGGFCGAGNRSGPILIGQWNNNYLMRNDISIFRSGYYASCINGQTITDFVAVGAHGAAALQPLSQFGFSIQSVA